MNRLDSSPLKTRSSYENPKLLECYPDIDYEMIPIKDDNNFGVGQSNRFSIDQLPYSSLKNILKTAQHFKLAVKPISEIDNRLINPVSKKMEITCIVISIDSGLTVLLPLEQIKICKKTKKYTKLFLANGQVLKTAISFKKLKKRLLKKGFTTTKKAI